MSAPPDTEAPPPPAAPAARASRRRHPLVLGTVAALIALAAAAAVAAVLAPSPATDGTPVPEVELRLEADDQEPAPPPLVGGDPTGQPVPGGNFSMLEGGLRSFADYRGTPLVVNFFASWCPPCVAEMPAFEAVHQELGADVGFLGVNLRDSVVSATELVERTGVTYDIARDPTGELATALGIVAMPSTVFVSADGVVVGSEAGELSADELRRKVEELVG
ncbi:MAG: TlpA family protein disulfide reductase [Actinomycetota bacterium]|nr:TlpA family protein disulfide reductase [Actinomycetota bacterium]